MTDDPWRDIIPPTHTDAINAKRVVADHPWNFFWARDIDRKCLLVLRHAPDASPVGSLPNLKGIEVASTTGGTDGSAVLVFRLLDSVNKDIFHQLCIDIVSSTSKAGSEKEAVNVALGRAWRWHHLLRGGRATRLSEQEQKGLLGELFTMECYLLPHLAPGDAIAAWHGPLGAPKDFEIGRICIESKARRGAATPYIVINSEHQLDDSGTDALFLHVSELGQAPADTDGSFSVTDVAKRIREGIPAPYQSAIDAFDSLLLAAGFRWEDNYSDSLWVAGTGRLYRVGKEFPRITGSGLSLGVSTVRYSLGLSACEPFLVADESLVDALTGTAGE